MTAEQLPGRSYDVGPVAEEAVAALKQCAFEFRELAGRRGVPEVVETPGDSLPQATLGNVVYDLGVAFSLAFGDIAEALDVEADARAGRPGAESDS